MYKVNFRGFPLHDPRSDTLQIREPDLHLSVGEAGEMSFTIDNDHPNADKLTRMSGVLEVLAGPTRIFRGRIRKDIQDFNLSRSVEAEGLLACLNDSYIPPFNFPDDFLEDPDYQEAAETGNVVKFLLGWFLDQHNSQVGEQQKIFLGDVTVADPNNYITRSSSDYLTTKEAVEKKLTDLLGGYLLPDYSGDTTVLHYYADLPLTNIQEVEFSKNLLDIEKELDAAESYTAILPVGKDGLTIAALEDGEISPGVHKSGLIIYSTAAENTLGGRITKKVDWQDVTEAVNLQTKAAALLTTEGVKHTQTITVSAVDLGGVDNLPHFVVGRYVQLKSKPHGLVAAYPLVELDPNILDPGDTQITLGATTKTASDIAHSNQSASEEIQSQMQATIIGQQQTITQLTETVRNQATEIIKNAEAIILSALEEYATTTDLEAFKQTTSSQLALMSTELSLKFTETTEHIVNIEGDLQKTMETLTKHFDFTIDGLTIKAGENTMSLRLDNGIISFQKNGQQFGWWDGVDFHTGNIVIDVNERAQFGNFAAIPRSTGNLSWLKVRG